MDVPPSQTIYVSNLYEKLPKEGVQRRWTLVQGTMLSFGLSLRFSFPAELKKCMYALFSQFGKIIDVVSLKTVRLRGQTWIVFTDVSAATNALRTMQGFPFFEKPMVRTLLSSQQRTHSWGPADAHFGDAGCRRFSSPSPSRMRWPRWRAPSRPPRAKGQRRTLQREVRVLHIGGMLWRHWQHDMEQSS